VEDDFAEHKSSLPHKKKGKYIIIKIRIRKRMKKNTTESL
jgi:hypothetical protein